MNLSTAPQRAYIDSCRRRAYTRPMDGPCAPLKSPPPALPRQPNLAELLGRCDFARLHPDRLRRVCEKWEIGGPDAPEVEE